MDKWLSDVYTQDNRSSSSSGSARRTGSNNFVWKDCEINLGDPQLLTHDETSAQTTSDALLHVDINKSGFHIWRINGTALDHWRREDYGQFYGKDCFLLLHIRTADNHDDHPTWTLHLWAGRSANAETYRQAVYRVVSLNGRLNNEAILHREPQGKETTLFKAYFPFITYWKGSALDSYWRKLRTNEFYFARLLKCHQPDPRQDHYRIVEVPTQYDQLNPSFVFILDRGKELCQWNGDLCMTENVLKASKYVQQLKSNRGIKIKIDVINDKGAEDELHPFFTYMTGRSNEKDGTSDEEEQRTLGFPARRRAPGTPVRGYIIRVISENNSLKFKKVKDGILAMKDVTKEKTCILDLADLSILWFSESVTSQERKKGIIIMHEYLRDTRKPLMPSLIISQGQRSPELSKAFQK